MVTVLSPRAVSSGCVSGTLCPMNWARFPSTCNVCPSPVTSGVATVLSAPGRPAEGKLVEASGAPRPPD